MSKLNFLIFGSNLLKESISTDFVEEEILLLLTVYIYV